MGSSPNVSSSRCSYLPGGVATIQHESENQAVRMYRITPYDEPRLGLLLGCQSNLVVLGWHRSGFLMRSPPESNAQKPHVRKIGANRVGIACRSWTQAGRQASGQRRNGAGLNIRDPDDGSAQWGVDRPYIYLKAGENGAHGGCAVMKGDGAHILPPPARLDVGKAAHRPCMRHVTFLYSRDVAASMSAPRLGKIPCRFNKVSSQHQGWHNPCVSSRGRAIGSTKGVLNDSTELKGVFAL